MKKQTITKIIFGLLMFVFVMFVFQFATPTHAATTSMANLYANPNQGGNNTYKFKVSDVVNSNLLTNIVGCTGVVNKVATWMMTFVSSPFKTKEIIQNQIDKTADQLKQACAAIKKGVLIATGATPLINNGTDATNAGFEKNCATKVDATNQKQIQTALDTQQAQNEANLKTQCFDGIAITLAKNQLSAMTRSMMNWVNSGYGGNPFFVQNMTSFTNNLEKGILTDTTSTLMTDKRAYPYGSNFSTSVINSYKTGSSFRSNPTNFLDSLTSDLSNFITDPNSYPSNRTKLQQSTDTNNTFANDFSTGGWNGWLALTQKDQNNPLGFTMQASQYLQDQQTTQTQSTKDELMQNNGFLSQKECVLWQKVDAKGNPEKNADGTKLTTTSGNKNDKCIDSKVITPGSLIKDKTSNYLNSPERQLELAKTINDSLNALFSVLVSKLEGGGLSGLSDASTSDTNFNWTDNLNNTDSVTSSDGNSTYNNNGAYDGFNLTRDLGNTYIHDNFTSLGTWNANTNLTSDGKKLYPDLAPGCPTNYNGTYPNCVGPLPGTGKCPSNYTGIYPDCVGPNTTNSYYTVITAGNTKLMTDGYNGWAVGDRAFWDGSKWQNWKCGTVKTSTTCPNQSNPIKTRGVIQIQQDYVVAAKEILKVLPKVMTNLGELDYCLPGPNPSYKTNSTDAQSAYQDWFGSLDVSKVSANTMGWTVDWIGTRTYDNLMNTYTDNQSVWNYLRPIFNSLNTSLGVPDNVIGGVIEAFVPSKDYILNYANTSLFQNFYEAFDEMMNRLYFKPMVNKYLETESSSDLTPNPAYIPMAQEGLDLTKNITYYNDDITKATQEYTDAINQAKINIAKLDPIKTEVSAIIIAAQDRQIANIITALKKLNGSDSYTPSASEIAKYRTDNKACLAEENIQVFDADTLTTNSETTKERCTDGIDNDLNGLIDAKDPACSAYYTTNTTNTINARTTNTTTTTTTNPRRRS